MHIASAGAGDRTVDVELNIVPYIDMMSCLTAFLLITAVWTNNAQIPVAQSGVGQDGTAATVPSEAVSVLLTEDSIVVGTLSGRILEVDAGNAAALEEALRSLHELPTMRSRHDLEVAAEDGVAYAAIITAMDVAIASGFDKIGFVDPASLTVRFRR